MASKIELANDVVVESGYKQIETTQLHDAVAADTAAPALSSDGIPLRKSFGAIVQAVGGCDCLIWGYWEGSNTWSRIRELDQTGIDSEGNTWKGAFGGVDRIYVQLVNVTAPSDVWFHRSYS